MNDRRSVWLYDEDTGEELEVEVVYDIQPAEPDVGISQPYAELGECSAWFGIFGRVVFNPAETYVQEILDKLNENLFSNHPNY